MLSFCTLQFPICFDHVPPVYGAPARFKLKLDISECLTRTIVSPSLWGLQQQDSILGRPAESDQDVSENCRAKFRGTKIMSFGL